MVKCQLAKLNLLSFVINVDFSQGFLWYIWMVCRSGKEFNSFLVLLWRRIEKAESIFL